MTTDKPINCRQYPLKEDQRAGIQDTINGLLESGVIYEIYVRLQYTTLSSEKKTDFQNWRMTQAVSLGNEAADLALKKKAAGYTNRNMLDHVNNEQSDSELEIDKDYVKELQKFAGLNEHSVWKACRATKDEKGIWRNHEGKVLAPVPMLQMLFDEYHTPTHHSYDALLKHIEL